MQASSIYPPSVYHYHVIGDTQTPGRLIARMAPRSHRRMPGPMRTVECPESYWIARLMFIWTELDRVYFDPRLAATDRLYSLLGEELTNALCGAEAGKQGEVRVFNHTREAWEQRCHAAMAPPRALA